jgi:hypothetical protein
LRSRLEELEERTAKAEKAARDYKEKAEARAPMMQNRVLELHAALADFDKAKVRTEKAVAAIRETLHTFGAWR